MDGGMDERLDKWLDAYARTLRLPIISTAVHKNKSPASKIRLWQPTGQPTRQPISEIHSSTLNYHCEKYCDIVRSMRTTTSFYYPNFTPVN